MSAIFSAFDKLKNSLSKTKDNLLGKISQVVLRRKIDDDLLDEIEEILIEADVGVRATMKLIETLKEKVKEQSLSEGEQIITLLKDEISTILSREDSTLFHDSDPKPVIWLIVGVNGVGKTTTIGKLATNFAGTGKKVMIADNVLISTAAHKYQDVLIPIKDQGYESKGNIIICDGSWIGVGSIIMSGVRVGKNSVVGANSVVTHDIPPFSVAAGSPARVIKRYDTTKKRWLDTRS